MIVLLVMAAGFLLAWFLPLSSFRAANARFMNICIVVLIFSMGVTVGARPRFPGELLELGADSAVLALLPVLGSLAVVYPLAKKIGGRNKHDCGGAD